MIDGIIFDVDGTLWDSRNTVVKSWNQAIKECAGCDVVVEKHTFDSLLGLTNDIIMEKIFPMLSGEEREKVEVKCIAMLHELLLEEPGELYDGVAQMLSVLAEDYKLFIVSNCQQGYIEVFLKATGFGKYITDILSYGDTLNPKGMNIKQVIQKHKLKSPVYVGDMEGDGAAARYAGIPILYVTYGFGTIADPDYTADTPEEVVEVIHSIKG